MKTKEIKKPKFKVDVIINVEEERQAVVKISYDRTTHIRIWNSTFLKDSHSNHVSKLIGVYNVGKYPYWKLVPAHSEFTLVFEGLPKSCTSFHLVEEIPEPGGMYFRNIARNTRDIYRIKTQ
jgi:hypothetical protein